MQNIVRSPLLGTSFVAILVFALGATLIACAEDEGRPGSGSGDGTGGGRGDGTGSGAGETADQTTADPAPETETQTDPSSPTGSAKTANAQGPCASDTECESGVCFSGGMQSYCSVTCTMENAATTCGAPFTGSCNKQGFCKRD